MPVKELWMKVFYVWLLHLFGHFLRVIFRVPSHPLPWWLCCVLQGSWWSKMLSATPSVCPHLSDEPVGSYLHLGLLIARSQQERWKMGAGSRVTKTTFSGVFLWTPACCGCCLNSNIRVDCLLIQKDGNVSLAFSLGCRLWLLVYMRLQTSSAWGPSSSLFSWVDWEEFSGPVEARWCSWAQIFVLALLSVLIPCCNNLENRDLQGKSDCFVSCKQQK